MPSETVARNPGALRAEVEQRLVRALSDTVQQYQIPAHTLAHDIGVSEATIAGYRQRIPQAVVNFAMIGRVVKPFGLEFMDAMNIDLDGDRAAFAKFLELQKLVRGQ